MKAGIVASVEALAPVIDHWSGNEINRSFLNCLSVGENMEMDTSGIKQSQLQSRSVWLGGIDRSLAGKRLPAAWFADPPSPKLLAGLERPLKRDFLGLWMSFKTRVATRNVGVLNEDTLSLPVEGIQQTNKIHCFSATYLDLFTEPSSLQAMLQVRKYPGATVCAHQPKWWDTSGITQADAFVLQVNCGWSQEPSADEVWNFQEFLMELELVAEAFEEAVIFFLKWSQAYREGAEPAEAPKSVVQLFWLYRAIGPLFVVACWFAFQFEDECW